MCSQLAKKDEKGLKWEIDNARWFSSRDDHCNVGSVYEFTGNCKIHGADVEIKENTLLFVTVYGCINGCAQIMKMWNGDPNPTIKYDEIIKKWIVEDISINDFKRDVKADWDYMGTEHSQYKEMVIFEEVYHAYAQMQNTAHWFYGQFINAQSVFKEFLNYSKSIFADNVEELTEDLQNKFDDLLAEEIEKMASAKTDTITCQLEKEAKRFTKQTHFGTYYCSKILHGNCSD